MASNINPNNINGAYPIAGQDNDSQGFRDNFTNIRTNLNYAKVELEDLQSKVVLKSPLTGGTVANNFRGTLMTGARTLGFTDVLVNHGTQPLVTGSLGTLELSFDAGAVHMVRTNGPIAFVLQWSSVSLITGGAYASMKIIVEVTGDTHSVLFPASVTLGNTNAGLVSQNPGDPALLFFPGANALGTYMFELSTVDAGANVIIRKILSP
jgi:hypothetical protein